MKKILMLILLLNVNLAICTAQSMGDYNKIKLFIDNKSIEENNKDLEKKLQDILYKKLVQLVNQTGTVESGYSNFVIIPILEITEKTVDRTGIIPLYFAECELSIFISRRSYGNKTGAATFTSMSKKIYGSAENEKSAISNALNSIKVNDQLLVVFLSDSRKKINEYFQNNCNTVIEEASEAYKLNEYAKSIALYFSIPQNTPCYEKAKSEIEKVYTKYVQDLCEKDLLKLNALIARAYNNDSTTNDIYDEITNILTDLDPSNPESKSCYIRALKLIEKIESRFDTKQKQEWELKRKKVYGEIEIQKDFAKAAAKISSTYQPPNPAPIIINNHK